MRKLALFFPILVLVLTFSACGKSNGNLNNRIIEEEKASVEIQQNEPIEGVLKAQPVTLNMYYGTHLLEDEMGAFIVYLQSKKINLSAYTDKKVSVSGNLIETYDKKKIIEVTDLEILDTAEKVDTATDQIYVSPNLGINLVIPKEWQSEEDESKLMLFSSNQQVLEIEKIENENERALEKFVDEDNPVELTIGNFEAIRTIDGEIMNVYIKAELNIFKLVFTPVEKTEAEKSKFYALLKTFALNSEEGKERVKVCAGAGKIKCDSGYRCEVNSEDEMATGLCVKIDGTEEIDAATLDLIAKDVQQENENTSDLITASDVSTNSDIPAISEQELAQGYYFGFQDQKKPGTPSNWVYTKAGRSSRWHVPQTTPVANQRSEKFQVIDYINAHIKNLASQKGIDSAIVQGYEFSDNRVVSVILKTAAKKYKIQYQYNIQDEFELALTETAYFEEGDGRDWVKVSGADAQIQAAKEVVSSAGETKAVVSQNMRLYENTNQNFTLQYPSNWYYSSFGSVQGALWHTGFGNQAVELGNEVINVDIFSGKVNNTQESSQGGVFLIKVPRDDSSHFEIYGDVSYADTIRAMASTVRW